MNTPNAITLTRICMIPLIVFFYLADFIPYGRLVATILFVLACVTDFLDGFIARKYNKVTTLGKFFDSIADKMLVMTGFVLIITQSIIGSSVVFPNWLGIICVIIILAREFIVSALRQLAASKGTILAADMGGKVKATAQFIVITLYMALAFVETEFLDYSSVVKSGVPTAIAIIRFVLMLCLIGTTFLTIYTGAGYIIRNRSLFKDTQKETVEALNDVVEGNESNIVVEKAENVSEKTSQE